MQNSSLKYILYSRKSTDVEDKQILSIEAQIFELREFAKREGLNVIDELIEKRTAKIPGRPIFNSMIERIEKGEANGILSFHPDRLARNSVDGGRIIYLLDTEKLKALKFPQFWFESTPQGKFMLNIAFGQSKYYVDSLSENTKRGLRQKVRRGEYPSLAPIGYLNDVRSKTIVVDKRKSKIIQEMFALYSQGNKTLGDISRFLAKKGIVSTENNILRKDRISYILSNPFYVGLFRYSKEVFEGKHDPIISKKLFDKVQEVLKRRSKPQRAEKIPKAYCGFLHCGHCGMMITAEQKEKYYKGTNRNATYTYYHCTRKSKTIRCLQPFIREEELDQQLSSLIQKVSLRQDWAKYMLKRLGEDEKQGSQSCLAFVLENRDRIAKMKQKLQLLLDSYLDQIIEREVYLQKKAEIMSELRTLEEQNIRFEQKQNAWIEPMREWINEAAGAAKIAKDDDLFAKKDIALKIFGSNLVLENKKARGFGLNPYNFLALKGASLTKVDSFRKNPNFFPEKLLIVSSSLDFARDSLLLLRSLRSRFRI